MKQVDSSSTKKSASEVVDRVHITYALKLAHDMVSATFKTSSCSMRTTTIIFDTGSDYNAFRRSALRLRWQRHVCADYKIPPVRNANQNVLQISSAAIKRIKFWSAVYKLSSWFPIIFVLKYELTLNVRATTLILFNILVGSEIS